MSISAAVTVILVLAAVIIVVRVELFCLGRRGTR
jgi:hypothetical protein